MAVRQIVGSLILIAASPLMLLTAIAIKLDSRGPVLFKQKRYGFNNELIEVYKFRSMYVDQCDAPPRSWCRRATRASPGRRLHPQRPRSTSCPQRSTWCSRAISRWSGRARTPSTPRRRTVFMTRRSTAISRATGSSPDHRMGARSAAGAARPIRTRRSSAGSSTISTTSRTGRCCSLFILAKDADRARPDRERVLMSTIAATSGRAPTGRRLATDIAARGAAVAHRILRRLRLHRAEPLRDRRRRHDRPVRGERLTSALRWRRWLLSLVLLNIGYAMAVVQVSDQSKPVVWSWSRPSWPPPPSSMPRCSAPNTQRRLDLLMRGYLAAALIAALAAIGGYFHLLGGASDMFLLYAARAARSTIPTCSAPSWCCRDCWSSSACWRGALVIRSGVILLVMLAALFLSFSRGAWGNSPSLQS